ncbi:MAG: DegV family protein [Oscillospiraceae bacterium]|nr:DegV family protein [Oscillospiraceae bacterium]
MAGYQVTASSTTDLPADYYVKRSVPIANYRFHLDGEVYLDDFGKSLPLSEFYRRIGEDGAEPTTSQLNLSDYISLFEPILHRGEDVLHLEMSSAITGSIQSAYFARDQLSAQYPDRRIYLVDTLAASAGYGLLLDKVLDFRDEGMPAEELYNWTEAHKLNMHHWFFTSELKHLRRGGRVSASAAIVGTFLNICPLMNMSNEGKLTPRAKIRGKKHVVAECVRRMAEFADGGTSYSGKVFLSHSANMTDAQSVVSLVLATFPNVREVQVSDVGTVIGSHTGPGTVALFFWGRKRVD